MFVFSGVARIFEGGGHPPKLNEGGGVYKCQENRKISKKP